MRAMTFVLGALIALAAPAMAQVAEGSWINLFNGEDTFGWTEFGDAAWEVKDGVLTAETGAGGWLASTAKFQDFELEAELTLSSGTAGIVVRGALDGHPSENGSGVVTISGGDEAQKVSVIAKGGDVTATVNGKAVENIGAANPRGHIGIQYHHRHGEKARPKLAVKSIKLRPLGLKPLFDGKSLDGWNIIPDRKSKFAVIDGALNIKDGNGQIETAGTFRDFTLQLDVFSNGEHLNSGVFYRTPAGVFWKGYESQVRNQWVGEDRTKPVDFGTGGNYGNQPARKVVPSDKEWFTKTIVADGNHCSVWVNGYLVSDFYDHRPAAKDADGKNGYVSEAGTINLQGHDPTTDLSFKNINIQEYK